MHSLVLAYLTIVCANSKSIELHEI
jgi:hypothetical protein